MNINKARFDFEHNVIIISGKSGQGKSAVLDAIALCLSSKKRSSTYAEYVKQGHGHAKVELNCDINGKPVLFDLQLNLIRGTPYQMSLHYEGAVYRNTEAETVLKSFDIDYYADIIFSLQSDDFRDITQLSPTQRSHYLQRLLNFDFQKQKDQINKNLEEYKLQLNKLNTDIGVKEHFIKKELDAKEVPIKIDLTEDFIAKLHTEILEKQKKISEYQKNQEKIAELNSDNNFISNEILKLNIKKNEINNNINQIKEKREKLERIEDKSNKVSEEIKELERQLKEDFIKYEENVIEHEEYRKRLIDLDKEIDILKTFTGEYKNYAVLEEQEKCPLCGQDTREHINKEFHEVFLDKENRLYGRVFPGENFREKTENMIEELRTLESEKSSLLLKTEMFRLGTESTEKKKFTIQAKVKSLEEEKEDHKKRYIEIENTLNDTFNYDLDLEDIENKLKEKNKKLEDIKNKISLFKTEDITAISNEIMATQNAINSYYNDIKTNKEIEERNEKREKDIGKYKKEILSFQAESKNISSQQSVYEDALSILDKALPNYMVVKTCSSLQSEMNNFIQSIFPTYEVQLINSKKGCEFFYTKDNSILESGTKKRNNAWINSKMSSGFEKALLTIAFKVSLAQLYGINIFIGDEIDGAGDDESSEKLFEQLVTNSIFDQIFLISHKKAICRLISDIVTDNIVYTAHQGQFSVTESLE